MLTLRWPPWLPWRRKGNPTADEVERAKAIPKWGVDYDGLFLSTLGRVRVSSQLPADDARYMAPVPTLGVRMAVVRGIVREELIALPHFHKLLFDVAPYLHACCFRRLTGAIDDVEVFINPLILLVHIRATTRDAFNDFGNPHADRMRTFTGQLRRRLAEAAQQEQLLDSGPSAVVDTPSDDDLVVKVPSHPTECGPEAASPKRESHIVDLSRDVASSSSHNFPLSPIPAPPALPRQNSRRPKRGMVIELEDIFADVPAANFPPS
eukprot:EG_transcript_18046